MARAAAASGVRGWERLLTARDPWERRMLTAVMTDAVNARAAARQADWESLHNVIAAGVNAGFHGKKKGG